MNKLPPILTDQKISIPTFDGMSDVENYCNKNIFIYSFAKKDVENILGRLLPKKKYSNDKKSLRKKLTQHFYHICRTHYLKK